MADIFHEVDEEVRREQLKKLWDRYSIYLIALAVIVVLAVAAWRGYEWWEAKKAAAAGSAFEAAVALSDVGKHQEAENAFAKAAAEAPAGYKVLSRLRAASELAQVKPADGIKAFEDIAADSSIGPTLQDLATVRAGLLMIDKTPYAEMKRQLDPLTESSRTFRHSARELLVLSAWLNHDFAEAKRYIDMMAADPETPAGARARVQVLAALINSAAKG